MTALSYDPRTGAAVAAPSESTAAEVDAVARRGRRCGSVRRGVPAGRATALAGGGRRRADGRQDRLVAVADEETALGSARLTGELERAAAALRFYGAVAG